MMKCDFCSKKAVEYGFQQCYLACEDHLEDGQKIEDQLMLEYEHTPLTEEDL